MSIPKFGSLKLPFKAGAIEYCYYMFVLTNYLGSIEDEKEFVDSLRQNDYA